MADRFAVEFKIDYLNAEGIGIQQHENQMRSIETQLAAGPGHANIAAANRHHARDPQRTLKLLQAA
jgi:hypothetical protein